MATRWRSGRRSRAADPVLLFNHEPTPTIEKLISLSRAEFEHGVERLTGAAPVLLSRDRYDLSASIRGRTASCTFDKQPDTTLGLHLR